MASLVLREYLKIQIPIKKRSGSQSRFFFIT